MSFRKFKIGDMVEVKKYNTRPYKWNSDGYMDHAMGKVLKILPSSNINHDSYHLDGIVWPNKSYQSHFTFQLRDLVPQKNERMNKGDYYNQRLGIL